MFRLTKLRRSFGDMGRHEVERGIRTKTFGKQFAIAAAVLAVLLGGLAAGARAQTDCNDGNGVLDMTPPKGITEQEVIQKFTAQESKVRDARMHYIHTQDVLVQTLDDKSAVDGQFHEIATVSYDDKGRRQEKVTFGEQSTLRQVQLTQTDFDDIHTFMAWTLTKEELPLYNLTYAGQQHVDDLDTYVFHIVPKKEEKGKRYFDGKVWVDNRDFEVVKLCGKSVPDMQRVKKGQSLDIRPQFVSFRQLVDGQWFPAFARVDDTLNFKAQSIHIREIVKYKDYKKAGSESAAAKP
jgi:hypothetical protein